MDSCANRCVRVRNLTPFTIVGKHLAGYFGLDAATEKAQTIRLVTGDGSAYAGPAQVQDLIMDGNLGTRFLSRYDVVIDLEQRSGAVIGRMRELSGLGWRMGRRTQNS